MGRKAEGSAEAEPRAAATLVILREGVEGAEVLITIRPKELRFMGGVAVFPGGAVAPEDSDPRWSRCSVLDGPTAATALGADPLEALAAYICAIRESYEEVAYAPVFSGAVPDRTSRPGAFLDSCLERNVVLQTDRLVPAGRWVTPLGSPVRFDARFFVTEAPGDWEPDPDPGEVAEAFWIAPSAALERWTEGELLMAPPTVEMLQRLALGSDVASILMELQGESSTEAGIETFSAFVRRVVAPNPGLMTGPGTNTYIVGAGPVCVIDPAVDDPAYIDTLLSNHLDIDRILITHRHPDHVGGVAVLAERTGAEVRAFGDEEAGGVSVKPIVDEEVIDVGGVELRALFTPGHAPDHLCFYLDGAASLFAGDNVLGFGTAVISPPEGNMKTYVESLQRLRSLHISRIYPGHFPPLDGGDAIVEGYLQHRAERNEAIVAAVGSGASDIPEIVGAVYTDVSSELHPIAEHQVRAHLEMLEQEGRVFRSGNRWLARGVYYSEGD
ncbi:MAG TPA: MBL fold metallo-hydrolase [Actinomycetota bacterium]|nr:MBL fold metallo-hydrolase [Actinomycetota bacterium]